jgi:hypothetical protein
MDRAGESPGPVERTSIASPRAVEIDSPELRPLAVRRVVRYARAAVRKGHTLCSASIYLTRVATRERKLLAG